MERRLDPSPLSRIILVRHGRSAHLQAGWLDSAALDAWLVAYDAVGLARDETAPEAIRRIASEVGLIVTSDLPRAIESAALLVPETDVPRSPLLRETPLPIPPLGRIRLPFALWELVIGLRWLRDLRHEHRETHAAPRARAQEAAQWLAGLADAHGSVLAVTHGAFRRYLADALEARGWRRTPRRRRYHHWGAWELTLPPSPGSRS